MPIADLNQAALHLVTSIDTQGRGEYLWQAAKHNY